MKHLVQQLQIVEGALDEKWLRLTGGYFDDEPVGIGLAAILLGSGAALQIGFVLNQANFDAQLHTFVMEVGTFL